MTEEEVGKRLKNFDLVSDAFNAEPLENEFLDKFKTMLEDEFMMKLCNEVQGANDAKNLEKMREVLNEMRLIAECPELHSKSIGAIGGGFSSGKSTFINSFLEVAKPGERPEIILAEGETPVTAIPSYVVCNRKDFRIDGISFEGGRFHIDLEMYKSLSHKDEYVEKTFSFLGRLIIYTVVHAPMEDKYFSNLCLIDTPGYNSPQADSMKRDAATAIEAIKKAGFLIWLVNVERGTLEKSDIKFLKNLNRFGIKNGHPLYIVATNARQRTEKDIKKILDEFEKTLEKSHLSYEGITVYDSKKKKVYEQRKKPLHDFFMEHNKPSESYGVIKKKLNDVFADYIKVVVEKYNWANAKRKELLAIRRGVNSNEDNEMLNQSLTDLMRSKSFNPEGTVDDAVKKVRDIKDRFVTCLDDFCDKANIPRMENRFCIKCCEVIQGNETLCSKCMGKNARGGDATVKCPKCGKDQPGRVKFCSSCGESMSGAVSEKACSDCGTMLPGYAKFCDNCGGNV